LRVAECGDPGIAGVRGGGNICRREKKREVENVREELGSSGEP
jgi:hypothetical protein